MNKLKGVILAGGSGTRLRPFTKIINKHLLPVGSQPMLHWSIVKLKEAGITDILIITGQESVHHFQDIFGDGKMYNVKLSYAIQPYAGGISHGLLFAKEFVKEECFVLLLGDNIFADSLTPFIQTYMVEKGAKVLLKQVADPKRYGVAKMDHERKMITFIVEKPSYFVSNYCVTGIYMYDSSVFDYVAQLEESDRKELEITDLNNMYIENKSLTYEILDGWWIDAGTPESLYQANRYVFENIMKAKEKS